MNQKWYTTLSKDKPLLKFRSLSSFVNQMRMLPLVDFLFAEVAPVPQNEFVSRKSFTQGRNGRGKSTPVKDRNGQSQRKSKRIQNKSNRSKQVKKDPRITLSNRYNSKKMMIHPPSQLNQKLKNQLGVDDYDDDNDQIHSTNLSFQQQCSNQTPNFKDQLAQDLKQLSSLIQHQTSDEDQGQQFNNISRNYRQDDELQLHRVSTQQYPSCLAPIKVAFCKIGDKIYLNNQILQKQNEGYNLLRTMLKINFSSFFQPDLGSKFLQASICRACGQRFRNNQPRYYCTHIQCNTKKYMPYELCQLHFQTHLGSYSHYQQNNHLNSPSSLANLNTDAAVGFQHKPWHKMTELKYSPLKRRWECVSLVTQIRLRKQCLQAKKQKQTVNLDRNQQFIKTDHPTGKLTYSTAATKNGRQSTQSKKSISSKMNSAQKKQQHSPMMKQQSPETIIVVSPQSPNIIQPQQMMITSDQNISISPLKNTTSQDQGQFQTFFSSNSQQKEMLIKMGSGQQFSNQQNTISFMACTSQNPKVNLTQKKKVTVPPLVFDNSNQFRDEQQQFLDYPCASCGKDLFKIGHCLRSIPDTNQVNIFEYAEYQCLQCFSISRHPQMCSPFIIDLLKAVKKKKMKKQWYELARLSPIEQNITNISDMRNDYFLHDGMLERLHRLLKFEVSSNKGCDLCHSPFSREKWLCLSPKQDRFQFVIEIYRCILNKMRSICPRHFLSNRIQADKYGCQLSSRNDQSIKSLFNTHETNSNANYQASNNSQSTKYYEESRAGGSRACGQGNFTPRKNQIYDSFINDILHDDQQLQVQDRQNHPMLSLKFNQDQGIWEINDLQLYANHQKEISLKCMICKCSLINQKIYWRCNQCTISKAQPFIICHNDFFQMSVGYQHSIYHKMTKFIFNSRNHQWLMKGQIEDQASYFNAAIDMANPQEELYSTENQGRQVPLALSQTKQRRLTNTKNPIFNSGEVKRGSFIDSKGYEKFKQSNDFNIIHPISQFENKRVFEYQKSNGQMPLIMEPGQQMIFTVGGGDGNQMMVGSNLKSDIGSLERISHSQNDSRFDQSFQQRDHFPGDGSGQYFRKGRITIMRSEEQNTSDQEQLFNLGNKGGTMTFPQYQNQQVVEVPRTVEQQYISSDNQYFTQDQSKGLGNYNQQQFLRHNDNKNTQNIFQWLIQNELRKSQNNWQERSKFQRFISNQCLGTRADSKQLIMTNRQKQNRKMIIKKSFMSRIVIGFLLKISDAIYFYQDEII